MKLTVAERLVLLGLLPQEGTFVTLKVIKQARERISFTEEELVRYNIKEIPLPSGGANVTWDMKLPQEEEIPLGERVKAMIIDALTKLDKDGKLTANHYSLYTKFVEPSDT
jgi:hypothetical protein